MLEGLEVRMFGQSKRQHGPRLGVDINSYVVSYKSTYFWTIVSLSQHFVHILLDTTFVAFESKS